MNPRDKNKSINIPTEPPMELLASMALRLHHDFYLDRLKNVTISCGWTKEEREVVIADMRKLYDEVSGKGFYKWDDSDKDNLRNDTIYIAIKELEELKNNPKLWKAGGAGGQDQYAGMPPAIRRIDAVLAKLRLVNS